MIESEDNNALFLRSIEKACEQLSGFTKELHSKFGTPEYEKLKRLHDELDNAFYSGCDIKIVAVPKLTDLAKQVKAYRAKHNLSQEQLADKAGLSRWTVINIEQGKSCSITTREAILEAIRDDRN